MDSCVNYKLKFIKMEEIINKIFKEKYPKGLSVKYTKEEMVGYMMAINDIKEQLSIQGVVISAFSKDYTRLFDKISKGEIVPCFVDYFFSDIKTPQRDIAQIKMFKDQRIMIGVRGMQYGGVDDFALDGRTVLKAFTDECNRLNLEYNM